MRLAYKFFGGIVSYGAEYVVYIGDSTIGVGFANEDFGFIPRHFTVDRGRAFNGWYGVFKI